jgi:hypothetical protein
MKEKRSKGKKGEEKLKKSQGMKRKRLRRNNVKGSNRKQLIKQKVKKVLLLILSDHLVK